MVVRRLKCIAQRKGFLPEARKKKTGLFLFDLATIRINCKPCISKIVYGLIGLNQITICKILKIKIPLGVRAQIAYKIPKAELGWR